MRRALAVVALAATALIAVPAPAEAAGAVLTHYSPDNGYDNAFHALCDWTDSYVWVDEGQSSRADCTGGNVTSVYVYPGQEIWCYYSGVDAWVKWADATGSHSMGGSGRTCVSQAD